MSVVCSYPHVFNSILGTEQRMQQVVPQTYMKQPSLNLDHDVVLSAWEQIGGEIFLGSELQPTCFDIDLSGIEASLKQSSSASLDQFSNISPVPNLFPAIPDFSFPTLGFGFGLPDINPNAEVKSHDKSLPWSQPFMSPSPHCPANGQKSINTHIKMEPTVQEQHGSTSCSSLSSNSADVAIVPEVTSHPATAHSAHQGSPVHVPQAFVPTMMQPGATSQVPAVKPMDTEVWRTRKECLERYKEKKARRMYTKKIRYQLRKINADKRPRIKGRFVKKEELDEYMKMQPICEMGSLAEDDEFSDVDKEEDVMSDKE